MKRFIFAACCVIAASLLVLAQTAARVLLPVSFKRAIARPRSRRFEQARMSMRRNPTAPVRSTGRSSRSTTNCSTL